jgi:hypothetical protein
LTLTDLGAFGFIAAKDFQIIWLSNILTLAYLMKVIPETRRAR